MSGLCPDTFYCEGATGSHGYSAISTKLILTLRYVGLISAVLSVFGTAIILFAYCVFKDLRRGTAQTIIALLALADLGTALGSLLGISNFMTYSPSTKLELELSDACWIFHNICEIQAFLAFWCGISSSIWSAVLAVHFLLATILDRSRWTAKLMPFYNIVAWTSPLVILLPLLITRKLGYTPTYQTSCYIANDGKEVLNAAQVIKESAVWIIAATSAVIIFACYTIITIYLYRKRHNAQPSRRIGKRLLAIPITYLSLKLCDLVAFCVDASTRFSVTLACGSDDIQIAAFVITSVEVIGYSGQGWINCILYVFLSAELTRRLFVLPFKRFFKRRSKSDNLVINESTVFTTAPFLEFTQQTQSTRARAQEDGETYYSIPSEFPSDCSACSSPLARCV